MSEDFEKHLERLKRFEKWFMFFKLRNPVYREGLEDFIKRAKELKLIS